MKVFAIAAMLAVAFAAEFETRTIFKNWMNEFNVTYTDEEQEMHRFMIFEENWRRIQEHNAGDSSYTLGLNQFADLTQEEFVIRVHGSTGSCLQKKPTPAKILDTSSFPEAPASVDWSEATCGTGKCVTAVKNQGQCGSCWAFSTTGSIESATAIKNKEAPVPLSEQQLVDCSRAEGNEGCNGGLMDNAFKYVEKEGGLCSETEYPYKAADGTCKATSCKTLYDPITSYTDVKADSEPSLMAAVAQQPVSIAVEADQFSFQFYSGGILDGECGTKLDHGVLAVGYGTMDGKDYWKVKNSWGASWGDKGYLMICRNCEKNAGRGECGILMQPSWPTAK